MKNRAEDPIESMAKYLEGTSQKWKVQMANKHENGIIREMKIKP